MTEDSTRMLAVCKGFLLGAFLSCGLEMSEFLFVAYTSSLTFAVTGIFKVSFFTSFENFTYCRLATREIFTRLPLALEEFSLDCRLALEEFPDRSFDLFSLCLPDHYTFFTMITSYPGIFNEYNQFYV